MKINVDSHAMDRWFEFPVISKLKPPFRLDLLSSHLLSAISTSYYFKSVFLFPVSSIEIAGFNCTINSVVLNKGVVDVVVVVFNQITFFIMLVPVV